ncbi:hypothetical protein TNCV_2359181 [Trichonephila clavipes]|nr:hypothetical protein TNCV_2359181 [Trichonephila clavipes]
MTPNLHDSVESDLRVSLVNNGWWVPIRPLLFSLLAIFSAPDHRPPRRSCKQRVVGPYSATVLVASLFLQSRIIDLRSLESAR